MQTGAPTFPQLPLFSSLELVARAASQLDGARVINPCMRKVVTENESLVGKVVTAHNERHQRWSTDGTWDYLPQQIQTSADMADKID